METTGWQTVRHKFDRWCRQMSVPNGTWQGIRHRRSKVATLFHKRIQPAGCSPRPKKGNKPMNRETVITAPNDWRHNGICRSDQNHSSKRSFWLEASLAWLMNDYGESERPMTIRHDSNRGAKTLRHYDGEQDTSCSQARCWKQVLPNWHQLTTMRTLHVVWQQAC